MKADNTPNVSDLARWIDIQLSTIIEGISAGYTLGNYNSVWIDKGATVFNVLLANGETVEIDSDNYNTAEEIANAIISVLSPESTPATMNANEATEMEKTFNVYLWCGCGYCLDCFPVCASSEGEALDKVVAEVISAGYTDYYMSEAEMEQSISDGDVYAFPDFNEVEGWTYIDATMEGAPYPVWLRTENLKIEAA